MVVGPVPILVPIPKAKKKGKGVSNDTEWTEDRIKENEFVNQVRDRISRWRQMGDPHVTRTTAQASGILD